LCISRLFLGSSGRKDPLAADKMIQEFAKNKKIIALQTRPGAMRYRACIPYLHLSLRRYWPYQVHGSGHDFVQSQPDRPAPRRLICFAIRKYYTAEIPDVKQNKM
jgi:hypothetical protein